MEKTDGENRLQAIFLDTAEGKIKLFKVSAVGFFTRSDIGPARNIGTNEYVYYSFYVIYKIIRYKSRFEKKFIELHLYFKSKL